MVNHRRCRSTSLPLRAGFCVALAMAGLLAACSSKPPPLPPPPPPPPPPPVLMIQLQAGAALNPDARQRPSPVVLRVYELKSAQPFEAADFVSLNDKDQAVLGADLVAREEMVLQPGDARHLSRNLKPDSCCIGVMAAFRDLDRAHWRSLVKLQPGKDNTVTFMLDGVAVQGARSVR